MNFEWRTEEDEQQWDNGVVPPAAAPGRKRWPWLVIGLVVLLIGVGVGILYSRLEQRAEAVAEAIEADVLTAHALLRQANERGDRELFSSLLSGSDPTWSAIQRHVFATEALIDRAFLGLAAGTEAAESVQVVIAPDLNTAELASTQVFTVTPFNSPAQTVRLQQVFVYRQEEGRWLLAPPSAEFWGRPVVNRGPRLTLIYPERDGEIGSRLAVYLEQLVSQLCAPAAGLGCPADWQLEIELATEPDTLLGVVLRGGREMKLPAPSLVGMPLDEAGYIALRRAYGTALANGLVMEFGGSVCCGRRDVAEALLAWQLHLLDLQPWPMRPADYQALWQNPVSLSQLATYWDRFPGQTQSEGDWRPLYALVEFLGQIAPEPGPLGLRRQIEEAASYEEWLRRFLPYGQYSDAQLDERWLEFNAEKLAAVGAIAPIDLPADDLLLTCRADPSRLFDLVRYDLATGLWQYEVSERDFYALYGLPDRSGVLMMDQIAGLGGPLLSRVSLWQDGREQTVYTGPTFYYYDGQADPSGQQLVLLGVDPAGEAVVVLLDRASCAAGACQLQPLAGIPVWAPDGRQTIVLGSSLTTRFRVELTTPVYQGDRQGQIVPPVVGAGGSPFWMAADRYGYVGFTAQEIMAANTGDNNPHVLLTSQALAEVMLPGERAARLFVIRAATMDPTNPDQLFLQVQHSGRDHIFSYRLSSNELRYRFTAELPATQLDNGVDEISPELFSFSPNGRWLMTNVTTPTPANKTPLWQQYLYDTQADSLSTFSFDSSFIYPEQDWSADGQWLARLGDGFLLLSAPGYDYQQVIVQPFFDCTNVVWVAE